MHNEINRADILRAVTDLAIADLSQKQTPLIKVSVMDACEALIDAGLIPIEVAPDVWRCNEVNQQHSVDALRAYLESQ